MALSPSLSYAPPAARSSRRLPASKGASVHASTPWPLLAYLTLFRRSVVRFSRMSRPVGPSSQKPGPLPGPMTGPRPARTCKPRPAGRWRPPPARDSDEQPPLHSQHARSEPDPGPCLRPGGYGTGQ